MREIAALERSGSPWEAQNAINSCVGAPQVHVHVGPCRSMQMKAQNALELLGEALGGPECEKYTIWSATGRVEGVEGVEGVGASLGRHWDAPGCKWMQVDASGCKPMQVDASGCKWMQVDASGCKWMQVDPSAKTCIHLHPLASTCIHAWRIHARDPPTHPSILREAQDALELSGEALGGPVKNKQKICKRYAKAQNSRNTLFGSPVRPRMQEIAASELTKSIQRGPECDK